MNSGLLKKDGTMIWGLVSSTPEFDHDGNYLGAFGTIMDITSQKQQQKIQETRIHLMQFARTKTLDELLQETLDKLCVLTNSSIGFYHFLEADQKTIFLQAWSTDTKKYFCQAKGEKLHYDIDEAGVWVDCIRQRKPVIHNDYAALEGKRGLPPGHALVIRELVVPVFRDDIIVAVIGVGNKPVDYDQNDIDLVSSFADLAWDIADKKNIENILIKNESLLEDSQKMAHLGSYEIDIIQNSVIWSKETLRIFGLAENDPAPTIEEYQAFIHPEDVQELYELFDDSLRTGKDFELTYRIIRANGEIRTVFSLGKITRDKTGQITGMTGTIQDITENQADSDQFR